MPRSIARLAFRAIRGECVVLYDKGYSANAIMEQSGQMLHDRGVPRGTNLHSRMLVAMWNLCPREGMPTIHDQLANIAQFQPEDSPALEAPWWKLEQ